MYKALSAIALIKFDVLPYIGYLNE